MCVLLLVFCFCLFVGFLLLFVCLFGGLFVCLFLFCFFGVCEGVFVLFCSKFVSGVAFWGGQPTKTTLWMGVTLHNAQCH